MMLSSLLLAALALVQGAGFTPVAEAAFSAPQSSFGDALALDGDTALVASWMDAAATVHRRANGVWTQEAVLSGWQAVESGVSVALRGDVAAVGIPGDDSAGGFDAGTVFVFERAGASWALAGILVASNAAPFDRFGTEVAVDGDTLMVGAPTSEDDRGTVYVFERQVGSWVEQALLVPVAPPGSTAPDDGFFFGRSIAIDGDRAAIASPFNDLDGIEHGHVSVFERSGSSWLETAVIPRPPDPLEKIFGRDLDLEGDRLLIGDPGIYLGMGSAYLYELGPAGWTGELEFHSTALDGFGAGVALGGERIAVSAQSTAPQKAGAVLFFDAADGAPLATIHGSGGMAFGIALALDGATSLIGEGFMSGFSGPGAAYVHALVDDPLAYCTAGTSASGCAAALSAAGLASATASSGFALTATGVEGQKSGQFFFGTGGRQASPWGNGTSLQCVVPPVARGGLLPAGGTPGACDGGFTQDLNALWCASCPRPAKNPGPGAVVQAQLWYRDPLSTGNQTTSLSDALEFTVAP